jgi:hypothetical protein
MLKGDAAIAIKIAHGRIFGNDPSPNTITTMTARTAIEHTRVKFRRNLYDFQAAI